MQKDHEKPTTNAKKKIRVLSMNDLKEYCRLDDAIVEEKLECDRVLESPTGRVDKPDSVESPQKSFLFPAVERTDNCAKGNPIIGDLINFDSIVTSEKTEHIELLAFESKNDSLQTNDIADLGSIDIAADARRSVSVQLQLSPSQPKPTMPQANITERKRNDRRVKTINDIRSYMNSLEIEANEKPSDLVNRVIAEGLCPTRLLTQRVGDAVREARLERIQSHDHGADFTRRDRELLETRRRVHLLRAQQRRLNSAGDAAGGRSLSGDWDVLAAAAEERGRKPSDGSVGSTGRTRRWLRSPSPKTASYQAERGGERAREDARGRPARSQASLSPSILRAKSERSRSRSRSVEARRGMVRNAAASAAAAAAAVDLRRVRAEARRALRNIDPSFKGKVRVTEETRRVFPVKMLLTLVIGFTMGAVVQLVSLVSTQLLFNPKQAVVQSLLDQGNWMGGYALHAAISVVLAVAAGAIVVGLPGRLSALYAGCPGAGGSGLPEVKTYLSGALDKHRMHEPRTLVCKIIAISFVIASGIPAARDMIHVSAILANNVVTAWAAREKYMIKRGIQSAPYFSVSDKPKFVFVSAAVAAGVGASLRCPLAGVVFAFEEYCSYWSPETATMCLLASALASLVAWYLTGSDPKAAYYLSNFEDTSGDFDPFTLSIIPAAFAQVAYPSIQWLEIGVLMFLGVLGGLWGSFFVLCNGYWLAHWRKKNMGGPYQRHKKLVEIALIAVAASALAVLLPCLWPCRPLHAQEEKALLDKGQRLSWASSTCPDGEINEMATLTYHSHGTTMNNLFAESDDMQFSASALFTCGVAYFFISVISVGAAGPAGAVVPMVLCGASWGRMFGTLTDELVFDYEGNRHPHVRFLAVMGGAAAMSGFFRLPLSTTALIVEVTGNTAFTAPLFLCCTIARVVADRVAPGFINFMCRFNDYPLLKEAPPDPFRERTALDIMTELDKGVVFAPHMLGGTDGPEHGHWLLESTKHNAFPVVRDRAHDWTLQGLIKRRGLAALVHGLVAGVDSTKLGESRAQKCEALSGFQQGLAMEMEVQPPVVSEGMPADRVYSWFVTLGLRRLLVVKEGTMQVTGVITRHDLHEACLQWH